MKPVYRRGAHRSSPIRLSRPLGFEPLESRQLLAATPIAVHVAGTTGTEQFQLQIDGLAVATWMNTRINTSANVFDTFNYTHPTDVSLDRIRVALLNDGNTPNGNRDLRVDGVTLNGVKYETEAPTVFSNGTWSSLGPGLVPGFRQSEWLHYNGGFSYGQNNSVIHIRAAGATGQETMQLLLGGQVVATYNNVGGNFANRQFVDFSYAHTGPINLKDVRVAFTNDGLTSTGADKNLRVDGVAIGGVDYQTEAATTFTTGFAIQGQGRQIGRFSTEILYYNGYFQFDAPGSVIDIRAAGKTGEERMLLVINGQTVATFNNVGGNFDARQFQTFVYLHPTTVPLGQVRIVYNNDGVASSGVSRDLKVDAIEFDGVTRQAEAADVFTTGAWLSGVGQVSGFWQNEALFYNGFLQFASTAQPGTLALGTTQASVNEDAGTVSIPVTRTGGSDGHVAVRYTTVNGSATAGSDFTGASAQLLVFAPGETTKSIVVPITNDMAVEGVETFNVATDQTLGMATLGFPRTATITIIDNDSPPPVGNGNGLRGTYFDDANLATPVFERTDATVNFTFGTGSPSPDIGVDTFSVRWAGKVQPRYTETFTFRTTSDDGVRLWVNGQLLIDQWNNHTATDHTGSIALVAGQKYDIVMEYYENTGSAVAKLAWSSSSQTLEIIPQTQLYSDPPAPDDDGEFAGETLITGLTSPTAMAFDASGRMFVSEQRGIVRVYQNGQLLSTPFLDIRSRVNNFQDRGMLGVAVHPNFPATPYVYVSYTYDPAETLTRTGNAGPDGGGNRVARVSRFTADPATGFNTALANSEVVLIGTNSTWANISHPELDSTDDMTLPPSGGMNGTLRDILIADSRSHTIGNIAFGPDGMLYVTNGDGTSYGRVDERTVRVQNIDSLSGKMLRVDPITGRGLADNPFFNGDPDANRSKVLNYGLRNPFRFALQPGTGIPFIGDVGWTSWEEINHGRGENFGWPFYEGGDGQNLPTNEYSDLPQAQAFYNSNPDVTPPTWSRLHDNGAVAIVAGDFNTGSQYPVKYRDTLFLSDIGDNQWRSLKMNPDGTPHSVVTMGVNLGFVVEMTMGADGYMYYVDLVGGTIGRLTFTPDAPAALMASPSADLDGNFQVDGNDFLEWQRRLGSTLTETNLADWRADMEPAPNATSLADELNGAPFLASVSSAADEAESEWVVDAPLASSPSYAFDSAPSAPAAMRGDGGGPSDDAEDAERDAAFATLDDDPFTWVEAL